MSLWHNLLEDLSSLQSPLSTLREKFFQTKAELAAARNISGKQEVETCQASQAESEAGGETEGQTRPDGLLQLVRERFSANLENSLNTIIALTTARDDGLEVGR